MPTEANHLVQNGLTRQEAFEKLVEKYKLTNEVANVFKKIPSSLGLKKYATYNVLLLIVIIFRPLLSFIFAGFSFSQVWYIFLIYFIVKKDLRFYNLIAAFSAFSVIALIGYEIYSGEVPTILMIFLAILCLLGAFLPYWLDNKMAPDPTEEKVLYTNDNGENRMKIVYTFPEI